MSLHLRLAPDQDDREFVTLIADRGHVRMIAKIARPVIEDAFPNADYVRDRLALVERNVEVLARVVQEKVGYRGLQALGRRHMGPHRSS